MAQNYIGPKGRPKNPGEPQLWWDIQDIVGPASLWPHIVRRLFWQTNLNYCQRHIIAAFVFVNGLNPTIFFEWVELKHLARDQQAFRHLAYLFNQFEKDPTQFGYGLYAFNVTMGHYQKINGQRHTYQPSNT